MAESSLPPSSTSEEPSIEKPGLGLLIHGTTPSDPITTVPVSEILPAENGGNDSLAKEVMLKENEMGEEKFRVSIEKEMYKLSLEQAEIEAAHSELEAIDDVEERNDQKTDKIDDIEEEKVGKVAESVEGDTENQVVVDGWGIETDDLNDGKNVYVESVEEENENENEVGYEENVGDQSDEGSAKVGRHSHGNNRMKSNYPMRPDAEDCTYYMKFGTCKFGLNCKYNHPPRRKNQGVKEKVKHGEENYERTGQTECRYHMTPGGCKYGNDCKYIHGSDNSSISHTPELNFLGLPIRLGEKECPYYMRTGSCKYGSSCRFHHPEPTTVGGSEPGHGDGGSLPPSQIHPSSSSSVPSWSSPRAFSGTSPFGPVYPPIQGVAPPNPEWNGYQAGTYPTSERGLPTPPAFSMKNLPTQINLPLPHQFNMLVDEYPERPGEPECSFFLKTGDCKYKSGCKFHHPKNRKAKTNGNSFALSEKGLPLRPGQPICAHYDQYGICKYGPACKYDHPSNIGVSTPFN